MSIIPMSPPHCSHCAPQPARRRASSASGVQPGAGVEAGIASGTEHPLHRVLHHRVVQLAQVPQRAGQVHRPQHHRRQAVDAHDLVDCRHRFRGLDLGRRKHVRVGAVDVLRPAVSAVARRAPWPETPPAARRVAAGSHELLHLRDGVEPRQDHAAGAGVETLLDPRNLAARHPHQGRRRSGAARDQVRLQRLEGQCGVLQVDPQEVEQLGQRLGHRRVGGGNTAADADLSGVELLAERTHRAEHVILSFAGWCVHAHIQPFRFRVLPERLTDAFRSGIAAHVPGPPGVVDPAPSSSAFREARLCSWQMQAATSRFCSEWRRHQARST